MSDPWKWGLLVKGCETGQGLRVRKKLAAGREQAFRIWDYLTSQRFIGLGSYSDHFLEVVVEPVNYSIGFLKPHNV